MRFHIKVNPAVLEHSVAIYICITDIRTNNDSYFLYETHISDSMSCQLEHG